MAQGLVEGLGVGAELPLLDDGPVALVVKLDRILDCHDHPLSGLADPPDHGGQGGRLSRSRHAGHQDQAPVQIAKLNDRGPVAQVRDGRNALGNVPEGRLHGAAAEVGIPAETTRSHNLQSEIKLQIPFEAGTLRLGQQSQDDLTALLS